MLSSLRSTAFRASQACLQQQTRHFKCSVLGAAGGIGQPLALLMSINPRVTALTCYDVTECTFVESTITEAKFFASPVTLGKEGVETIHDYGVVNEYEKKLIADMMPDLIAQAEKGIKWANEAK